MSRTRKRSFLEIVAENESLLKAAGHRRRGQSNADAVLGLLVGYARRLGRAATVHELEREHETYCLAPLPSAREVLRRLLRRKLVKKARGRWAITRAGRKHVASIEARHEEEFPAVVIDYQDESRYWGCGNKLPRGAISIRRVTF